MNTEDTFNENLQEHRRLRLAALIDTHCYGRQSILVKRTGIHASMVSEYLKGTRQISEKSVHKIEAAIGVVGWFAQGEGDSSASAVCKDPAHSGELPNDPGTAAAQTKEVDPVAISVSKEDLSLLLDLRAMSPEDSALLRAQARGIALRSANVAVAGDPKAKRAG